MQNDTLDIEQSESEFKLTVEIRNVLHVISIWSLVSGILGLVISFLALFVLFMMVSNFAKRNYFSDDEFIGMCLWTLAIIFVIILSRFLILYRRNWKKAVTLNSSMHLKKALKGLKNALIMNTIVFIILSGIGAFGVSIVVYTQYIRQW